MKVKEESEKVGLKLNIQNTMIMAFGPVTSWQTAAAAAAKSLQLCLTLGNPVDGSSSGSSIPGILQARILEWVAMLSSRASS